MEGSNPWRTGLLIQRRKSERTDRAPGRSKGIVGCYTGEGQKEETL